MYYLIDLSPLSNCRGGESSNFFCPLQFISTPPPQLTEVLEIYTPFIYCYPQIKYKQVKKKLYCRFSNFFYENTQDFKGYLTRKRQECALLVSLNPI